MNRNHRWYRSSLLLMMAGGSTALAASAQAPVTRIERDGVSAVQTVTSTLHRTATNGTTLRGGSGAVELALTLAPYRGDPEVCGSDTSVDVRVGEQVNLCYTITNHGSQALTHHSLSDSVDGDLLAWEPLAIAPGESRAFVRTVIATTDTTRSATLTSYSTLPHYSPDDGATPGFVDIAGTGTDLGFVPGNGNDNEYIAIQAGFPLRLYGVASSDLCVSIDGFIGFDDAVCETPSPGVEPQPGFSFNADIPTRLRQGYINVPGYLAPYWTNLDDGPGRVYVQTLGSAPARRFIVQWNDLRHYINSSSTATFQVIFDEASDDIRYEYRGTAFGNIADHAGLGTVGLQGDPRGLYAKYSYNEAALRPDSAIVWNYTAAVDVSATSGSVSISAGDPVLAVAQASLAGITTPGGDAQATLTVRNAGNRDLSWSVTEAPGGSRAHLPRGARHLSRRGDGVMPVAGTALHLPDLLRSRSAASARGPGPAGIFAVPTFGISILRPGLVGFDALDPAATYTPINASTDWIYAGAFLDNDFSRLWVIVQDSWDYAPGTYGTVDVSTGAFTVLGRITGGPSNNWAGLTQDPLSGMVYAANFSNNPFSAEGALYTIDFDTGQARLIGPIVGPGIHPVRFFPALAVSPDGRMYGLDLYGQSLIAIDKTSGYASTVEVLGLDVRYSQDIEFDPSTGDLYWAALYNVGGDNFVSEMRVIDPLSALSQPIAPLPPARDFGFEEFTALAIARPSVGCVAPGDVPWLSFEGTLSGTLPPEGSQDVQVRLDASGLAPGLYRATVCVFGDDPRRRALPVTVMLAVTEALPVVEQIAPDTTLNLFNNQVVAPPGTSVLSAESADDFVVDGEGWIVTAFGFTAVGNNGNSLPPRVNVRVLTDDGSGAPSDTAVCSAVGVDAFALGGTERILAFVPGDCELPAGRYWVAWSFADVDIASPHYGFAVAVTEQQGAAGVWRNPVGALGFGCTTWTPFAACGALVDASARDLAFSVYATPVAPLCDAIMRDGFEDTPEPDACPR